MSEEKFHRHVEQMNLHPCEERTEGKLCRREAVAMTALGKLLCQEHCESYEAKWNLKLARLQLMVDERSDRLEACRPSQAGSLTSEKKEAAPCA